MPPPPAVVYMLLLMVTSLSAVPHDRSKETQLSCGECFTLHGTFCYRYFGSVSYGIHQAEKLCSRYKASLVSLLTAEEEEFVVQLTENVTSFWTGLNDEEGPLEFHREGVFKWSDGQPFNELWSYQNWRSGEPNNRNHLDCVRAGYEGWAMAPGGCAGSKLPVVCKKQACPSGLEWRDSACSTSGSTRQAPVSVWMHTGVVAVWIVVATVLLTLAVFHSCRARARPDYPLQQSSIR